MKLYVWTACAIILTAPMQNANSKTSTTGEPGRSTEPHAKVEFSFSRDKLNPINTGGLNSKNLTINTDGNLTCSAMIGFDFDACGTNNSKECATIMGNLHCENKRRNAHTKFDYPINTWKIVSTDPQANPTTTPTYNIAGCSVHLDPHHLNGCLTRELRDNLVISVTALANTITLSAKILGCAACKTE